MNLVFGTLRILLWFWWAFLIPISVGVGWIASRHPALVNFSAHLWCLGPLKTFTLVISVNFLFACLPKCHILLVIVSFHLYCEARHYPRSMKPWNVRISALPGRVLNYQARRGLRTYVMSNTLACRSRTGWRSRGSALQNVRSFPWLLS